VPIQADHPAGATGQHGPGGQPRQSLGTDLRAVLSERNFRWLFATRLVSQFGDGVFTAGIGAYVFFDRASFPSPEAGAAAFAVLYLPYSLIGPFAGVFIDRWSRRQILVWAAVLRAGFVALTAAVVLGGALGLPLYLSALAVLGINRFFLSALSAALPHTVPEDKLVMANSVSPTVGGLMAALGGIAGLGARLVVGRSHPAAAAILLAAGCCYLGAGLLASVLRRDLLGPIRDPHARSARLFSELADVAAGLAEGARYVWRRRGPAAALGATGANRCMYGVTFLVSILLYRNYFYPHSENVSLSHYSVLVTVTAVGYGCAALVTPLVTRRLSKPAWIALLMAGSAVVTAALGETFVQWAFLAMGWCLGLAGQGVAICATTILQEEVDDRYRGRVFSFYDMMFNVTFVAGAAISAAFMPSTGKSAAIIGLVAVGFAVGATGYWLLTRNLPAGGEPEESAEPAESAESAEPAGPGEASPSRPAQSSSS
jgi:MFS family permease